MIFVTRGVMLALAVRSVAEHSCDLSGPIELDLERWRVTSKPEASLARAKKLFGSFSFDVGDGRENFGVKFAMVEGVPWPHPIDKHKYAQCHRRVRLRPGDVIVATYPKSGTTWVEQIVLLLLHGSRAAGKLTPLTRNMYSQKTGLGKVWLEPMLAGPRTSRTFGLQAFEAMPSPRVVKSHAPYDMLLGVERPTSERPISTRPLDISGARVIYVARNAKDAALSLYYQRAPMAPRQKSNASAPLRRMPMDAWCALYLAGTMSCGSQFDHTARWYAASRASKAILFITYEAIKREPLVAIRRIADHLGLARSPDEIERIRDNSTLDAMRQQATQDARDRTRLSRRDNRFIVGPGTSLADRDDQGPSLVSHLRQGRYGSWRDHFNARLSAQFDARYTEAMAAAVERASLDFDVPPVAPNLDFGECSELRAS